MDKRPNRELFRSKCQKPIKNLKIRQHGTWSVTRVRIQNMHVHRAMHDDNQSSFLSRCYYFCWKFILNFSPFQRRCSSTSALFEWIIINKTQFALNLHSSSNENFMFLFRCWWASARARVHLMQYLLLEQHGCAVCQPKRNEKKETLADWKWDILRRKRSSGKRDQKHQ